MKGLTTTFFLAFLLTFFSFQLNAGDRTIKAANTSKTAYELWLKNNPNFDKPEKNVLKENLTPIQYKITQQDGTERPFSNEYWDNKAEGIYVDIVSGEPLFSSTDKYKSGTGWPSFTRAISQQSMSINDDYHLFSRRSELRSSRADSHLGHLFADGPKPTGQRYCINSAALRFIPKEQLATQGYPEFTALFE